MNSPKHPPTPWECDVPKSSTLQINKLIPKVPPHSGRFLTPKTKSSGLLSGHINIRSLVSKFLQVELALNKSNLDFLGLSETWLNDSVEPGIVHIQGCFQKRPGWRKKGRRCCPLYWGACKTVTIEPILWRSTNPPTRATPPSPPSKKCWKHSAIGNHSY